MQRAGLIALLVYMWMPAFAQVPPVGDDDHDAMLASDDPQLAANKRLVYDWWREVFEAGHLELNDQYLTPDFIEHNPNVPTGREGVEAFIAMRGEPRPIQVRVEQELIAITAEGDLVTLMFVAEYDDPNEPGQTYRSTWYDTFRVVDGMIVEHWDPATIE
ncbi:nuclear transport factor 2 family protein [Candidatus Rariloculus sp.]|uniref:nuclear transport factor 2 family protein n=1 Tax=Candidatus Rariloculus sp. TaxID=3101265 RepID=UPI003D0BE1CB